MSSGETDAQIKIPATRQQENRSDPFGALQFFFLVYVNSKYEIVISMNLSKIIRSPFRPFQGKVAGEADGKIFYGGIIY